MRVTCPECGGEIPAADIDVATVLAKCRQCDNVFSFAGQVPAAATKSTHRPRVDIPRPSGVVAAVNGGDLRITRRWYFPAVIGLLAFCVAWDSFVGWMVIMMLPAGKVTTPGPPLLFFTPFIVAGVAMTWYVCAVLVNRTVIESDGSFVRFHHRPIPWRRGWTVRAEDIEQVYCQFHAGSNNSAQLCCVSLRMRDGRKQVLAPMVHDPEQALFIEQELERVLGIDDQHVPGELKT